MLDFRTGELTRLVPDRPGQTVSWASDSQLVAASVPSSSRIRVFDRTGREVGSVANRAGKQSTAFVTEGKVAVLRVRDSIDGPIVRIASYSLAGNHLASSYCALPSGYSRRATAIDAYDGNHIWIHALTDVKKLTYRYTVLDLSEGRVVGDIEHVGAVPYVDGWAESGAYITGVSGSPDGLYAVDARTAEMVRLSRLTALEQSGYENHANSQFAQDLIIFKGRREK